MSPETIFNVHLVLGYVAWLLCFRAYLWPRLKSMDMVAAQRAIATLHSFRFFGLVFIVPGVVGANLPVSFAAFAAYWDLATGVLAVIALLTVRIRPCFGFSWSPSISWGSWISLSTITMQSKSGCLRWPGSWAWHTRSRSSTYRY
jgi:hypothetical protein